MKYISLAPLAALSALLVSCGPQGGGEDYDVSNPYAAPDYGDDSGTPYQTADVNPAYDAPAVYEETTPDVSYTAPAPAPTRTASTKAHTIVRGDTLWGLSKKYSVSVAAIKSANNMTKDTVVLGSTLQIPAQ